MVSWGLGVGKPEVLLLARYRILGLLGEKILEIVLVNNMNMIDTDKMYIWLQLKFMHFFLSEIV